MPNVLRILDANANRAREALRVMEEAARFVLDDATLTQQLKLLRHDVTSALSTVHGLEANRDTPGDVGTRSSPGLTQNRASVANVVIAAGKRLSEALRALEEYGKTLGNQATPLAGQVESLRYRGYDLEQQLNRALGSGRAQQWRLCVLLSESLCTLHSWSHVLDAIIDGQADCIQVREKQMDDGPLLRRVREVVQRCRPHGISVVVNNRPDVAMLAGADGVHLGQTDLPCDEARKLVGHQLCIGVSTANLDAAKRALRDGADYCGVGPMFPTTTKHKDKIVGPAYLREYLAWDRLPHLAIAGITPENVPHLVENGARGVAVSGAVCSAKDPGATVRLILEQLPGVKE